MALGGGFGRGFEQEFISDELLRSVFGDVVALLPGGLLAGSAPFHCGTLDSRSLVDL